MAVQCLLAIGRPAAVARLVVAVVVDAVERPVRRPLPHVAEEVLEGIPALADRDASPAVALVAGGVRGVAAVAHRAPRGVRPRALACRLVAVLLQRAVAKPGLVLKAAARARQAPPQRVPTNHRLATALALARPE